MKYIIILFLTFVFCLTNTYQFSLGLRKEQSVGAKGITLCNGKPFEMVNIQLFEKDRNSFNDLMNRQYSDYFGRFSLYGSEKEFNTITPLIIIEHQCNTKGKERVINLLNKLVINFVLSAKD
uniref:Transthyretin-like family protein n=1 Tax=Rhabditophanes sp. KR3021 TaxID=114890 RepID=A0AC35TZY3_9BILA